MAIVASGTPPALIFDYNLSRDGIPKKSILLNPESYRTEFLLDESR